jgi:phosphoribosylformylglycinamidine synthase subunit PurL
MPSAPKLQSNPHSLLNVAITPELIDKHGLSIEEYENILTILGREPNLTELGIFSIMWSEHCSYKSSKALLRLFPTTKIDKNTPGQVLIKAGEENAGVIDIGDGWAICFKIESHNHPSAIEPFEGAATGVGGIIRDIFTMGARPVLLTNSLRFGDLDSPEVQRLFRGVVHGIAHYGNCIGIPNIGGDIYFDKCYEGNPLVNALCLGVLKHEEIKRGKASGPGNPVFYVGAATGRDGLGGASFASRELSEQSALDRPAVQKGDPFMEKLLLEACLEMMAIPGLVVGIQDMGAAGLTCSTCETASRGNAGIEIDLDCVPQRESGMNSYEIMLSESQERMLVIVSKGRESEMKAVFEKWDLHAVKIGKVTKGTDMVVKQKGSVVAKIPVHSLSEKAPVYNCDYKEPEYLKQTQAWTTKNLSDLESKDVEVTLSKLLDHPTISQKKWVWQQYDHMVMANTVVEPGSDAAVVRLRLDNGKEKFIAIANDCNNRYCYLNPKRGGQLALVECLRNLACSGARPLAMTDNLNFGNPNKPEVFYMMREAVSGLAQASAFFDVPCVGGNVSFYNENHKGAIDPTPVISAVGMIDRPEMITRQALQTGEGKIILLGGYPYELGGSFYLKEVHDLKTGDAPALDLSAEKRLHSFLLNQIDAGCILAAHDIAEGGLLVAIAEMLFSHKGDTFGACLEVSFDPEKERLDAHLFGESQSRILIAVKPKSISEILKKACLANIPAECLGSVTSGQSLTVNIPTIKQTFNWNTLKLRDIWENAIPSLMKQG